MKLKEYIDLIDFLSAVANCHGDVWFETPDGDRLNLKSELCKYLFATISNDDSIVGNAFIRCNDESDYQLIADYIKL